MRSLDRYIPPPVYAPRETRLAGQIIDCVIALGPLFLTTLLFGYPESGTQVLAIAAVCWALFYTFMADGLVGGQSLSKRWLGMQVVYADTREPCTFTSSLIRNFLLTLLGPVDWIFIFGEQHQRLGDKLANTIVISVPPR